MPPRIKTPGMQVDIAGLMSMLASNDIRFEITMNAIIELLEGKKLPDGTLLFTKDEVEKKIVEVHDRTMKAMSIAKPESGLIIPGTASA